MDAVAHALDVLGAGDQLTINACGYKVAEPIEQGHHADHNPTSDKKAVCLG